MEHLLSHLLGQTAYHSWVKHLYRDRGRSKPKVLHIVLCKRLRSVVVPFFKRAESFLQDCKKNHEQVPNKCHVVETEGGAS